MLKRFAKFEIVQLKMSSQPECAALPGIGEAKWQTRRGNLN